MYSRREIVKQLISGKGGMGGQNGITRTLPKPDYGTARQQYRQLSEVSVSDSDIVGCLSHGIRAVSVQ